MPNIVKRNFLLELGKRFGNKRKLDGSLSLYELGEGAARVYIRYSKVHTKGTAFYGLRADDLRRLEGHDSWICFLWDTQTEPLLVPFDDFEDVFQEITPASDGQYKVQIYVKEGEHELYLPSVGRFNIES